MEPKATVEIAAHDESWTPILPVFQSKGFSCVVAHHSKTEPIRLNRVDFIIVDTGKLAPWQAIMLLSSYPFMKGRIAMTDRAVDGIFPQGILRVQRDDMVEAIGRQFLLLGQRSDA